MSDAGPAAQLAGFIDRYEPAIAGFARAALSQLRRRLPGAVELVCDDYNALAIGFAPVDRLAAVVFSVALYPRWVTLFFMQGAKLEDPTGRLKGSGTKVRHIVLQQPTDIGAPDVERLIAAALQAVDWKPDGRRRRTLRIKSVAGKQRPRRTAAAE